MSLTILDTSAKVNSVLFVILSLTIYKKHSKRIFLLVMLLVIDYYSKKEHFLSEKILIDTNKNQNSKKNVEELL